MPEEREAYKVEGQAEVRKEACLPFSSELFRAPTKDEFRSVTQQLRLSGAEVGRLLGVHGRTVRKWIGGETEIPYSAWRLLLIRAGLATEDPGEPELEQIRTYAREDVAAQNAHDDGKQLTWGDFKEAVTASGVQDRDVIEFMQFVSKAFEVRTVEQNPGEPRYVQVIAPKAS